MPRKHKKYHFHKNHQKLNFEEKIIFLEGNFFVLKAFANLVLENVFNQNFEKSQI